MSTEVEMWIPVKGYEHYEISNLGRLRKISYLRPYSTKNITYPQVQLYETDGHGKRRIGSKDKGKLQKKFMHRLLAEAFIPNPENKPFVNHKDGNKLNNSLENLEWATASENSQHAYDIGLNKGGHSQQNTMIIQFGDDGIIKIWKGIREIVRAGLTWNKVYDSIKRGVQYRKTRWIRLTCHYDYRSSVYFLKPTKGVKQYIEYDEVVNMAHAAYNQYQSNKHL